MGEFETYLDDVLKEAYLERLRDLGYWCARCDVLATPFSADETVGWCCLCGLDPMVEGPPLVRELKGILLS
jgi:hypothetical protein